MAGSRAAIERCIAGATVVCLLWAAGCDRAPSGPGERIGAAQQREEGEGGGAVGSGGSGGSGGATANGGAGGEESTGAGGKSEPPYPYRDDPGDPPEIPPDPCVWADEGSGCSMQQGNQTVSGTCQFNADAPCDGFVCVATPEDPYQDFWWYPGIAPPPPL